jgi:hypothetical protein
MSEEEDSPQGLWLSLKELASRRGVAKSSLHERLGKLAQSHSISTRKEKGVLYINVAEFDRAAGEATDLRASTRHTPQRPDEPSDSAIYTREQARKASYMADLAKLDLDERRGLLIEAADVEAAATHAAELVLHELNALVPLAEAHADIVAREGVIGLRRAYKEFVNGQRTAIADALREIGQNAADDEGDDEAAAPAPSPEGTANA